MAQTQVVAARLAAGVLVIMRLDGGIGDKPSAIHGETGLRKMMDLGQRRVLDKDLAGMIDVGTLKTTLP